jgi:peptidyl-prolyl cis-trans isomerase C
MRRRSIPPRLSLCATLALLGLAACKGGKGGAEGKGGPVVATVGNDTITADEFRRRLDEVSPFLRARYSTVEHKKELLENVIRNELLAQEAERRGLDKSPTVREQMKRAMIQELLKQQLDQRLSGSDLSDAELQQFYDAHKEDYLKPERARVHRILVEAKPGDARARAAARKTAQALLREIDQREGKGDPSAFQTVAIRSSQDKTTAALGGDLRYLSKEELAKSYSPQLAEAAFALNRPGEKSPPIETPAGIELLKLQVKTVRLDRKFDEAKESIRGRIARDRRSREYDAFVKKLRDDGKVTIDDAALAAVSATEPSLSPGPAPTAPASANASAK